MKYMGSKRSMLTNGLGKVLSDLVPSATRFFDLFTGSGSVAIHVAERYRVPVIATDLQSFATSLAGAIVRRDHGITFDKWGPDWIARSIADAERQKIAIDAAKIQSRLHIDRIQMQATRARRLCCDAESSFVSAYGGWYFSPWQALLLDCLRRNADPSADWHDIAVASVIQAASHCAASPGHTAQPFKPDTRAAPFLLEAWLRDVIAQATVSASALSERHARCTGQAFQSDAGDACKFLRSGDIAFIDPPYSSVHYSRFYHVLESLARGHVGAVSGSGRYPDPSERPSSDFSIPSRAAEAMSQLLKQVASGGATAIVTFPSNQASNGLSGRKIQELAAPDFAISEQRIVSRFSTLGGNRKHRVARQDAEESILTLTPL